MFITIAIGTAIVAGLLASFVLTRPEGFGVSRSTTIAASPETIFPHINDLHAFQVWNPFLEADPACKQTWEGPSAGQGAIYRWDGNNKVGAGSMRIVESKPAERVTISLEFLRPFKGTNTAEFTFVPRDGQTLVTWTMTGKCDSFFMKAMHLVINMDKMIGKDFDRGLAKLKSLIERGSTT